MVETVCQNVGNISNTLTECITQKKKLLITHANYFSDIVIEE